MTTNNNDPFSKEQYDRVLGLGKELLEKALLPENKEGQANLVQDIGVIGAMSFLEVSAVGQWMPMLRAMGVAKDISTLTSAALQFGYYLGRQAPGWEPDVNSRGEFMAEAGLDERGSVLKDDLSDFPDFGDIDGLEEL